MRDLTYQRCYNHRFREAAARCPECARFFCRECITEHEDKVLCSACLYRKRKPTGVKFSRIQWILNLGYFFLGVFILYVLFFYFGRILLLLPSSFHEGTLWKIG